MADFNFNEASVFQSAEESPGFLLWRASTLWRRAIENVLKPLELTHPQFVILATIGWFAKGGKTVSQTQIAKHAGLDPNTTSQILRSLHTKGLIERLRSQDERSKCSTLTKEGAETLKHALPSVEKADGRFFSSLDLHKVNAMQALQVLADLDSNK